MNKNSSIKNKTYVFTYIVNNFNNSHNDSKVVCNILTNFDRNFIRKTNFLLVKLARIITKQIEIKT